MNASGIYSAIVASHEAPEWAVFPEVSDATGGAASRRADALALNLWPSRGLEVRGFEIKVSRSDLKRELDDPSKAEAIAKYCHTWCLATPVGLIRESDALPATWGLFEVKEDGTGRFKRAPTPRHVDEVCHPTRGFMAAIARASASEMVKFLKSEQWVRRETIQEQLDAAFRRGADSVPDLHGSELDRAKDIIDRVRPILKQFGIDVDGNRYEIAANRHIRAHALGMALVDHFGDDTIGTAMRRIADATKALTDAAAALQALTGDDTHRALVTFEDKEKAKI